MSNKYEIVCSDEVMEALMRQLLYDEQELIAANEEVVKRRQEVQRLEDRVVALKKVIELRV